MSGHSPLGASGAERWMNCPGSVALIRELDLPETDEPDYRAEGTAAHDLIESALPTSQDAWEFIGAKAKNGVEVTAPMADAVQVYLDHVRTIWRPEDRVFIEEHLSSPDHPDAYGTVDFGCYHADEKTLFIRDYKHGEGIVVEVENNPQIMYYAFLLLQRFKENDVETVDMGIVQPRGFHAEGPVRICSIPATHIREWAARVLVPAMERTAIDHDLDAGKWCRFCPAKLVCPLMNSLFGAAMRTDPKTIIQVSDETIARSYPYIAAVKSYIKALEEHTMNRLMAGATLPTAKLVMKKADRVWKDGAEHVFKTALPDLALYTQPEFKSPAQVSALGAAAKKLVHEYAYTPQSGLTVAGMDDKRPAVKPPQAADVFSAGVASMEKTE